MSTSAPFATDSPTTSEGTVIDFHVHGFASHMLPTTYYRAQAAQLLARQQARGEVEELAERIRTNAIDPTGELLWAELDAAGIQRAAIVGIDWASLSTDPEPTTHPLEHLRYFESLVLESNGRLNAIIGIDPRRPDVETILREAFDRPWVAGVKLYPPTGFSVVDPVCEPVYRAAFETERFVMFHTGGQTYPFELEWARLEQYGALQKKHPDLTIVLAHAGHPLWGPEALMIARGHPRTYLDVSGWNEEPADVSAAFIKRCFETVGARRVLFGSDFVAGPYSRGRGHIASYREVFEQAATECGVPASEHYKAAEMLLGPAL
jgi:predicted TIM-barrel fold metal-dependent hydrolase